MSTSSDYRPETIVAQAMGVIEPVTGAVVPPVHASTTYVRNPANELVGGLLYSRADNPNYRLVEDVVTKLEGGAEAAVFASGNAAGATVFQALQPGDHVLIPEVFYWALRSWILGWAKPWGLRVESVDMTDPGKVAAALRKGETKLVWIETPANPNLDVTDIAAVSIVAHEAGAIVAVDSTFATPVHTRPLEHGADLVMHSATKYLNGHSDVVAGVLVTKESNEFWATIKRLRAQGGAVLGPFEAWLLLRGLRTLHVRVRTQSGNAQAIAEHFNSHAGINAVLYPGLWNFPGHQVAASQMHGGFGGMLSLRVKGGGPAALKVIERVQLWKRATSLGGVESLIEHRATVEGPTSSVPPDLLRLSAGIEAVEDLIADLEQALGSG